MKAMNHRAISIVLITLFSNVLCRELGSKCQEELDWLNSILMERVEEDEFSVEPVLGVGVPIRPKLDATIEEVVNMVKNKSDTLTPWQIRECIGRYLKGVKPWKPFLGVSGGNPGQLGYEKPHYLGPIEPFPIPVPDDDDYKPGPEGYTTYVNPYNFMEKVPEYKPRPKPSEDYDYFDSSEESSDRNATTATGQPSPSDEEADGLDQDGNEANGMTTSSTTTRKPSTSDYDDEDYDYLFGDDDYDDYFK